MLTAKTISQFFGRLYAWIIADRAGVLLLVLQIVGIVGMLFYRNNIDAAFWVWGVVLVAAALGFLRLRNRSATPALDWIVFVSGVFIAAVSGYFLFLQ